MKFILFLRKFSQISFAVAVICLFSNCEFFNEPPLYYKDWILIHGKTTITRNGIPWNYDKYHPIITALSENGEYLGSTYYPNNSITWLGNGVYKWDCWIYKGYMPQDSELPYKIYFRITCRMNGIDPDKITDEFWVDHGTSVDLGNINYDIAKLYGNFPVTINGEAVNNITGEDYESVKITVRLPDKKWLFETKIQPNGDWSHDIEKLAADTELLCSISVFKNGGHFGKALPNMMYYANNDDIEFIFPGYQGGINFDAITLSGTIKTFIQNEQPRDCYVMFFLNGQNSGDQIGGEEVRYLQPNGDGSAEWSIMLPAFSFPQELFVLVDVSIGNGYYQTWSTINITDETDLNNIDLGVFTGEDD
ncbi:MAG: hypothetical protein LBQ93_04700 [Treponema sp.]|jgi:hypothetical protein|nr:hypothetical protein [Treponema sp.]